VNVSKPAHSEYIVFLPTLNISVAKGCSEVVVMSLTPTGMGEYVDGHPLT
jgi:hypothetical protein